MYKFWRGQAQFMTLCVNIKCDLDLQPTRTNVSNDITTPQGEQLCQIILKIHS